MNAKEMAIFECFMTKKNGLGTLGVKQVPMPSNFGEIF